MRQFCRIWNWLREMVMKPSSEMLPDEISEQEVWITLILLKLKSHFNNISFSKVTATKQALVCCKLILLSRFVDSWILEQIGWDYTDHVLLLCVWFFAALCQVLSDIWYLKLPVPSAFNTNIWRNLVNTNIVKKREYVCCIRLSECSLDDNWRTYKVLKLNLCWTGTKKS